MVFSKEMFLKNASSALKKVLSKHLDALDGKEAVPSEDGLLIVEHYSVLGQEWYLYPVYPEWCIQGQMELKDFI